MKVLVACEYSGIVSSAFRALGHESWSCDVLPTEGLTEWHHQCDVRSILDLGWDLMIAHPPCTDLAVSGARHFWRKHDQQIQALDLLKTLMHADIPRICIENPVSIISSRIRPADQVIQPWWFGHGETKATCLWLKNLPPLRATNIVEGREQRVHNMAPGPDRWKERSRTLQGIADAMADQWGTKELGLQSTLFVSDTKPASNERVITAPKEGAVMGYRAIYDACPECGKRCTGMGMPTHRAMHRRQHEREACVCGDNIRDHALEVITDSPFTAQLQCRECTCLEFRAVLAVKEQG